MAIKRAQKDKKPRVVFSGRVKQHIAKEAENYIKANRLNKSQLLELAIPYFLNMSK